MTTRGMEILVGCFVTLGIAALFVLAMQVSNLGSLQQGAGYRVTAYFDNVGGLRERAPVRAAGVTVGRVVTIRYDQRTALAGVVMEIGDAYRFPVDTSASIYTAGLLGEQYVALSPGGDEQNIADGGTIEQTQSALVLEKLIGQFLLQAAEGSGSKGRPAGQ